MTDSNQNDSNVEDADVEKTDSDVAAVEENDTTSDLAKDDVLSDNDSPDSKWYVAQVMTGQENKVSKALKERIINLKLTEFFSQILVPEESVVTTVNGKKRTIKKKFFPGYILLKMVMNDKTWHLVKNTDKITGFVGGTADKPAPISDDEAAYMTNQAVEGYKKPRTSINFAEGESVRVIEGPFSSFVGTIEAVSDKGKVKVSVSIFGRPTPVELDFTQIEKIE
ncbi:MAG: transcription termination/antitermination protein NusG [Bacteriovoracaceae bacterium]|nr:transcription termination/antitermination protein NusG [Bacteriovoracaceae bacterium]